MSRSRGLAIRGFVPTGRCVDEESVKPLAISQQLFNEDSKKMKEEKDYVEFSCWVTGLLPKGENRPILQTRIPRVHAHGEVL